MLIIEFLQGFLGDRWLSFFLAVTHLGGEANYIVLLSLYFWLVNPVQGRQLGLILLLSALSNDLLKTVFALPRPYIVNPAVTTPEAFATQGSFSFPSGHAQGITTVWGMIGCFQRRRWVWAIALTLIFFVCLSRLYLGVHFPVDVAAGILLGILWVTIGLWLNGVEVRPSYQPWQKLLFWTVGGCGAIAFPHFAAPLGLFGGFFPVALVEHKVPQPWLQKITLGCLGIVIIITAYLLLKKISLLVPDWALIDYIRYLAIAWSITEGIPWLWRRIQPVR